MGTVSILGPGQAAVQKGIQVTSKAIEDKQIAIGSGRKCNSYGGLGAAADAYAAAESRKGESEAQADKISLTNPILKASVSLAETLRKMAEQGFNISAQALSGQLGYDTQGQAVTFLNNALDLMNTKINGLSISSGSDSVKTAWDKSNLKNPTTYALNASDDVAIPQGYQGDSYRQSFTLNGQRHEISLTGNELGPQRLVRAFQIMAIANPNDPADPNKVVYNARMKEASRLFAQAKDDMRSIEARLGLTTQQIVDGQKSAKQVEFEQDNVMQDINGSKTSEMIPELLSLSTHQSASFSVLGKDSELTMSLIAMLNRS